MFTHLHIMKKETSFCKQRSCKYTHLKYIHAIVLMHCVCLGNLQHDLLLQEKVNFYCHHLNVRQHFTLVSCLRDRSQYIYSFKVPKEQLPLKLSKLLQVNVFHDDILFHYKLVGLYHSIRGMLLFMFQMKVPTYSRWGFSSAKNSVHELLVSSFKQ